MLIGIVCTEPGGSKVVIVTFWAKAERVRIDAHRVRKTVKANLREIVRARWAREAVGIMLTPGQSARNAAQFDAGSGKKVERRFREPARARESVLGRRFYRSCWRLLLRQRP
jgi:hypothetical protein